MSELFDKLIKSVEYADDPSQEFSDDDFRWAETKMEGGKPRVYINHKKFKAAGAKNYENKMFFGEALHNLKNIDPDRYERLEKAALSSDEYMDWANESYRRSIEEYGEERSFSDWHRESRFDQVIGGYLLGGDKDIPTMKDWDRDQLPWGNALRKELDLLEYDLNKQ